MMDDSRSVDIFSGRYTMSNSRNVQHKKLSMKNRVKPEKIILFGDPDLRAVCDPVTIFHKSFQSKVDIVKASLAGNGTGAALAAPQIAILKRFTVINYLGEYHELINPVIVEAKGEAVKYEGCLSLPGFFGTVKRAQTVTVQYQDRNGKEHVIERSDDMARCFQHEIDHLDGILFIDRMEEEFVFNDEENAKISVKELQELTRRK
jgi:peptide deformylase